MQELADAFYIFDARCGFETAVEVDAGKAGVAEFLDGLDAIRIDAAAEQEGSGAVVAVQQAPVELVAGAAVLRGFGVEEVVVAQVVVGGDGKQVFGLGDGECLDKTLAGGAQGTAVFGRLAAVELDAVQGEAVGVHEDVLLALVDENADALGTGGQVAGHFEQAAGGLGVEDEANHVYAQLLYAEDVVGAGHAAYFGYQIHKFSD